MGTKERRQREFEDREVLILARARELIHAEGLLHLQMSKLAQRCEHAVGTLYKHFESKEDLIVALATEGAAQHADLFNRIAAWEASPRDRIFGFVVADMVFVHRNPDHFRIAQYAFCEAVWEAASLERRNQFLKLNKPIGETVVSVVTDAVTRGDLKLEGKRPEQVTTALWSMLVGMHNLAHATGVMEDWDIAEPYRMMCHSMQMLLNGFGWQPLADPNNWDTLDQKINDIRLEILNDRPTH